MPLDAGEAWKWNFIPIAGLRGLVGPSPILLYPTDWPTLPALVGLTTRETPPRMGSDGDVRLT